MGNIDLIMATINKKFKADIIQHGTDIIEVDKIPFSSPTANYMTYGGVPVGKITEFFGGEGGGKTTSALDICGNAQKKFKKVYYDKVDDLEDKIGIELAKGTKQSEKVAKKLQEELDTIMDKGYKLVAYVDSEQTLDVEWANKLGVATDELILVRPQDQTAEQVFDIIIDIVKTGNIGLVVLDSIPMLVSQNIFNESLEKKSYGGISQALTIFCSKITPLLVQNQCAFIGINQIREDLSSMYNTLSTPGGKMWKHACSLRLRFKKDKFLDMDNNELTSGAENPAGNKVQIEIVKTKVCKPDRKLGYYTLNYTSGIDVANDTIKVGQQYGYIVKNGSWFTLMEKDKETEQLDVTNSVLKWQGAGRVNEYLRENPDKLEELKCWIEGDMYGNEN